VNLANLLRTNAFANWASACAVDRCDVACGVSAVLATCAIVLRPATSLDAVCVLDDTATGVLL